MDAILLQILNGLDKGGAYALIALGLTLIFGTLVSTALTVFVVPLLYELHAKRHATPAATGADHA